MADSSGKVVWRQAFPANSLKGVLPGPFNMDLTAALPADLPKGQYDLLVSVGDKEAHPLVRLAVERRRPDGWYTLGAMAVE